MGALTGSSTEIGKQAGRITPRVHVSCSRDARNLESLRSKRQGATHKYINVLS